MSFIAILGAGAARRRARAQAGRRGRVREVRLIDRRTDRGRQGARHPAVVANRRLQHASLGDRRHRGGGRRERHRDSRTMPREMPSTGETGLAKSVASRRSTRPRRSIRRCAAQRQLMMRAVTELRALRPPRHRSAPSAARVGGPRPCRPARSTAAASTIAGARGRRAARAAVIAWEEATASGQPVTSMVAPHRLAAISARMPSLWPPGPFVAGVSGGAGRRSDRRRLAPARSPVSSSLEEPPHASRGRRDAGEAGKQGVGACCARR